MTDDHRGPLERYRRMSPQERRERLMQALKNRGKTWEDFLEDMENEPHYIPKTLRENVIKAYQERSEIRSADPRAEISPGEEPTDR